jgi:folylpolyglutamate synthase/dihydropteroate synthase
MKDKEYKKCLNEIEKLNVTVVLTKPEYKRSINPEILYRIVKNKSNFVIKEKINEAYLHAKRITRDDDLILITGSFFLVSDFLKIYNNYLKSY